MGDLISLSKYRDRKGDDPDLMPLGIKPADSLNAAVFDALGACPVEYKPMFDPVHAKEMDRLRACPPDCWGECGTECPDHVAWAVEHIMGQPGGDD